MPTPLDLRARKEHEGGSGSLLLLASGLLGRYGLLLLLAGAARLAGFLSVLFLNGFRGFVAHSLLLSFTEFFTCGIIRFSGGNCTMARNGGLVNNRHQLFSFPGSRQFPLALVCRADYLSGSL